ncbi:MAG: polysaccharide deacetylase family protein [Polyangiaceae bacterium]
MKLKLARLRHGAFLTLFVAAAVAIPVVGCGGGNASPGKTSTAGAGAASGSSGADSGPSSGAGDGGMATTSTASGTPGEGLGPWTGMDNVPPSADPPFELSATQVPMFVSVGWDDNGYSGLQGSSGEGAMNWAVSMLAARNNPSGSGNAATFDGTPAKNSFYMTSVYVAKWMADSPSYVKRSWRDAYEAGHEIGVHTHNHSHGGEFSVAQWDEEIQTCIDWLGKPFDPNEVGMSPNDSKGIGIPNSELYGFRTPFLEYNDAALSSVAGKGFRYDCSIEEGWQSDQNGENYFWPFTLDGGSPGHDVLVSWELKDPISPQPGLWEMPVHPVVVPPDQECENYGIPSGLRAKLKAVHDWFDVEGGKITGFDYNLWVLFKMDKDEVLATLKYTLDLRLKGNRAPFLFGAHTDYYSSQYTGASESTPAERRETIEAFLDYALSKEAVRVVSSKDVLDWVRNPVKL